MGKVVQAVAMVGIAAVAVALAAPTGGLSLASAFSLTGFAATAVGIAGAAAFTALASFALQALASRPTSSSPGWQHGSSTCQSDGLAWLWPPDPPDSEMPSLSGGLRDPFLWPFGRFRIQETTGTCMRAAVPGDFAILDREATIRRGDYFLFGIDDMGHYLGKRGLLARWRESGLGKRFIGVDPDTCQFLYECTNPPQRMTHGLRRLKWAYRVRAVATDWWEARRLLAAVRADPGAFDRRLAGPSKLKLWKPS